jgi:hypothetical protein
VGNKHIKGYNIRERGWRKRKREREKKDSERERNMWGYRELGKETEPGKQNDVSPRMLHR